MKFLLAAINAKYIHSNLAVYNLMAYAKDCREDIVIREYTINHRLPVILKDLYLADPDVLLFSCYIWNISYIKELVREVYKLKPGVKIWLGGPEAFYDGRSLMTELPQAAGIMIGEGEESFSLLVHHYAGDGLPLAEIPGILYRHCGEILENPSAGTLDMSDIPFGYGDLEAFDNRIIYYESSRGCPFSCSYCLSSIDKKVRFRDIQLVRKELDFFLAKQVKQVKFVDRTFNCNHQHSLAVWNHIYQHDNGRTNFHFEIAADLLNETELALLKKLRPGLVQLEIGVQSTNEETLMAIRRQMDFNKVAGIVAAINGFHNIHLHLDLIAGLPFEGYDRFGRSFNDVYRLQPKQLQLGFLKVLKGSLMHQMADEYGIVYMDMPPYEVLYTKWLSYEEVLRLKEIEEIVEVYYNSGQFHRTLKSLVSSFAGGFEMYQEIAGYFTARGFFDRPHNRLDKYRFLREFIGSRFPERLPVLESCLILDLYAREKVKSRPDFARDLKPYKKQIQSFFMKEAKRFKYLPEYQGFDSKQLSGMTHIEVLETNGGIEFVLFNYKKRNPLTDNAAVIKIEEEDL